MSYDANEVAKLVIEKCMDDKKPVTNLKLQKILYFMWLDWYKEKKSPLFENRVEAWHYGPVIPDVYYRYRIFVADPIRKADDYSIPESDAKLMRKLTQIYNSRTAGALVDESHAEGSPWDKVGKDQKYSTEIPQELMIDESGRRPRPHL